MNNVIGIDIGLGKMPISGNNLTDDQKRFTEYYDSDWKFYSAGAPPIEEGDYQLTTQALMRKQAEAKQMFLEKSYTRFNTTDEILKKSEENLRYSITQATSPNSSHYDNNVKLLGEIQKRNAFDVYVNKDNKNKHNMLRAIDGLINTNSQDGLSYLKELIKSELPKNAQGIEDRREIMSRIDGYFNSKFKLDKLESELKWIKNMRTNIGRYKEEIQQKINRY